MTAINKNTTKSTKSPAPATKTTKPKAKGTPAPAVKVAPPRPLPVPAGVPAPAPAAARAAVPAPGPVPAPAPALKAVKATPVVTTITARIDVGFGNSLFVRGEGPGLSWDRGIAMDCVDSDRWQLTLGESARPFTFKLLVNDLTWSSGADFTVESGGAVTLTPEF